MSERKGFLDRLLGEDEPSVEALRKEVARQSERAALAEQGLERAQAALRNARDELATTRAILGREQREARTQRERAETLQAAAALGQETVDVLTEVVAELAVRNLDLLGDGSIEGAGFRPIPLPNLASALLRLGLLVSVESRTGDRLVLVAAPETAARPGLLRLLMHLLAATLGMEVTDYEETALIVTAGLTPMERR